MHITPGDFENPKVLTLIRTHLSGMHASSPPGTVYAFDVSALNAPGIDFFTAWDGAELLGMGALKEIDAATGEIKSMRTDPAHVRKGVAAALLEHIIAVARARDYRRLSLETGTGAAFEAAATLYKRYGFAEGEAFGDYASTEFNIFMHFDL